MINAHSSTTVTHSAGFPLRMFVRLHRRTCWLGVIVVLPNVCAFISTLETWAVNVLSGIPRKQSHRVLKTMVNITKTVLVGESEKWHGTLVNIRQIIDWSKVSLIV